MPASTLALFEHYMLADHRPAGPMNVLLRLGFTGQFDVAILNQALERTLREHPLLTCLAQEKWIRWRWVPQPVPPHVIELPSPPEAAWPEFPPLDVCKEPGFRLYKRSNDTHTELILLTHHASCDALGLISVAEDLLIHYARIHPDFDTVSPPTRDQSFLRVRHRFGWSRSRFVRTILQQGSALKRVKRFLKQAALPLASPPPSFDYSVANPSFPNAYSFRLSTEETTNLRQACRRQGVTVNDLFMAGLFLALAEQSAERTGDSLNQHLRLCIPVNFRSADQRLIPAVNQVSLCFLDRKLRDIHRSSDFLQSIHREMNVIKDRQQGLAFIIGLGIYQRLAGGIRKACRAPRCQSSAVLTNPGVVFANHPFADRQGRLALGSLRLDTVDILAPTRPQTDMAMAVYTYAGQLNLCVHYDGRLLKETKIHSILEHCLHAIKSWT